MLISLDDVRIGGLKEAFDAVVNVDHVAYAIEIGGGLLRVVMGDGTVLLSACSLSGLLTEAEEVKAGCDAEFREQGEEAGARGLPCGCCPYRCADERESWLKGWIAGAIRHAEKRST